MLLQKTWLSLLYIIIHYYIIFLLVLKPWSIILVNFTNNYKVTTNNIKQKMQKNIFLQKKHTKKLFTKRTHKKYFLINHILKISFIHNLNNWF